MKDKEPLISILVLTYNHEAYIRDAMESIFSQATDFDIEILIGDDASQDGTPDILKEYQQRYPDRTELVLREENIGASKNLFDLLQRARGKLLAFLEGDDFWLDSYKLQKQKDFLEDHPEYIATTHLYQAVDGYGGLVARRIGWIKNLKRFALADFDGISLPGHISSLMCLNIFDKIQKMSIIWEGDRIVSDRIIFFLLLLHGDIYQMQEPMLGYRLQDSENATNATNVIYARSEEGTYVNYRLTRLMEQYARKEGIHLHFRKVMWNAWAKILIKFILHPSRDKYQVIVRMWRGKF